MQKTKLTLSIDSKILKAAKIYAVQKETTLSATFERLINSLTKSSTLDDIMRVLRVKKGYVSLEYIIKNRARLKRKFDSGRAIRAMRDAREKAILG